MGVHGQLTGIRFYDRKGVTLLDVGWLGPDLRVATRTLDLADDEYLVGLRFRQLPHPTQRTMLIDPQFRVAKYEIV
jgi:hypothetical protein